MRAPPTLFDLSARRQRQARAAAAPEFLDNAAIAEIEERLGEVNRTFLAPAIIGPRALFWRDALGLDATLLPEAETLDLAPAAQDLVLHALSLHAANDPVGQLVQMRRALRPDGLMLAVAVGGATLTELRTALAAAESEVLGGLSPRVAPMADLRDLGGLLQRAGFALPVADAVTLRLTYPDLDRLFEDLRGLGETNVLTARHRATPPRRLFRRAAELYRERFALPDGRLPATVELLFLTGWAPAANQPQPLRPGSARHRFADALNTREWSAGEPPGD